MKRHQEPEEQAGHGSGDRAPSAITWPLRRVAWFIEERLIWPIADLFGGRTHTRQSVPGNKRRVLPWVAATLVVGLAAGALGAGVYLDDRDTGTEAPDAGVAAVPEKPELPRVTEVPPESEPAALQGVTPSFGPRPEKPRSQNGETEIKPAEPPSDPALKVAHRFANSFVSYEVGEPRPAALKKTSTPRLSRELASRPPRQPSSGKVPKARVLNVVKGRKEGRRLAVSVALQRSGAATELRLTMIRDRARGWKVSEVLG